MPIPTGFNNTVRRVTASPVTASALNSEIATQNTAGYWVTDIKFLDTDNAFLLFVKHSTAHFPDYGQKVNAVTATQAALDTDKGIETPEGYWPTGVFPAPGGTLYILYQQLTAAGGGE